MSSFSASFERRFCFRACARDCGSAREMEVGVGEGVSGAVLSMLIFASRMSEAKREAEILPGGDWTGIGIGDCCENENLTFRNFA